MKSKIIVLITILCMLGLPSCEKTSLDNTVPSNIEDTLDSVSNTIYPQSSLYGYTLSDKAIEKLGEDVYNLYVTKNSEFLQNETEGCYQKGYPYTSTLQQMKIITQYPQEPIKHTMQCFFPVKRTIEWEYTNEEYSIDLVLVGQEKVFFSSALYSNLFLGYPGYQFNSQIGALDKNTGKVLFKIVVPYREILNLYESNGIIYCVVSNEKKWEVKSKVMLFAFSTTTGEKKWEEEIPVSGIANLQFSEKGLYFLSSGDESEMISLYWYSFHNKKLELLSSYLYPSKAECTKILQDDFSVYFATVTNSRENNTINIISCNGNQPNDSWQIEIPIPYASPHYSSFSLYQDEQSIYVTYESKCIAIAKQTKGIQWEQTIPDYNVVDLRSTIMSGVYLLLEPLYQESLQSTADIEKFYLKSLYNRVLVSLDESTGAIVGKSSEAYSSQIGYLSYALQDHLIVLNPDRTLLEVIKTGD